MMNDNKDKGKEIPVDFVEDTQSAIPSDQEVIPSEEKTETPHETTHEKKSRKLKEDFKKKLEEVQKKYDLLNDQYLRLRAEFSNYKKRMDREQLELGDYIKTEVVKRFLPIVDDFDRMLKLSNSEVNHQSLLQGAQLIAEKFKQILNDLGIKKIDAEGQEFNPEIHEALLVQNVEESEKNGKIIGIYQDGYMLGNRLLRPSKVVVGKCEEKEPQN